MSTTTYRMTPGDGDPRHGTVNGYSNLKCRCQPCRAAHASDSHRLRAERRTVGIVDVPHGRPTTYGDWSCRCRPCTDAWTADCKARSARRKAVAA